jgi:hypothetical protein
VNLVLTGAFIERLRRDVCAVRPNDRVAVGIQTHLSEESRIMERLEYSVVLKQVGKVYVAGEAIREAEMNRIAGEMSGFGE